ncbi:hypothetical protein J5583_10855, partial [Streptococcus suis]|uniref:hypothetical protein n=1 Tax=Streptococcus suis TaxID=1307 RepID=UPI001ABE5638
MQLRYLHVNVNYNDHRTDKVLKEENKPSTASLDLHQHLAQLTERDRLKINHKALAKLIHLARALYYGFEPVFLVEKNKKTTSYAG